MLQYSGHGGVLDAESSGEAGLAIRIPEPWSTVSFTTTTARAAAFRCHAKVDAKAHTANARAAFLNRFEREVDPDGVLSPAERARRASYARRAYFLDLAAKSARSRRRKAKAQTTGRPVN